MQRIERTKTLQVRLTEEELANMHKLAAEADESVSRMLRRLARDEWARRFGAPDALPGTK